MQDLGERRPQILLIILCAVGRIMLYKLPKWQKTLKSEWCPPTAQTRVSWGKCAVTWKGLHQVLEVGGTGLAKLLMPKYFPLPHVNVTELASLLLLCAASALVYLLHAAGISGCSNARVSRLFPWSFQNCEKIISSKHQLATRKACYSLSKREPLASLTCLYTSVLRGLTSS